jgi:TetR/AcrR family transcriptional regulator
MPHSNQLNTKKTSANKNRVVMENQILRGAEQVFAQYGYRGASIDRIAHHIGISKQNLIYYFSSKEKLYRSVLQNIVDLWLERMSFGEDLDQAPEHVIDNYIRAKLRLSRDYPQASKVFAQEIIAGAPIIRTYLQQHLQPIFEKDMAIVRRWIESGYLVPFKPEHLFFTIWSVTQTYADFSTQIQLVLHKEQLDEEDFENAAKFLTQVILRGIIAPK